MSIFPARVRQDSQNVEPNLARSVKTMLAERDLTSEQLFDHVLATLNAPVYEARYIDALRVDWPRIPIPASNDTFARSAALGARLAALLDVEVGVDGVSRGALLPGLSSIGLPYGSSYEVTAGWGSVQRKDNGTRLIMPGAGMTTEREWIEPELEALLQVATRHGLSLPDLLDVIGDRAVDVEMNASAGWRAIPSKVWSYTAGGYQALKKWLSYRETAIMGRPLRGEEVLHFAQTARRITEILAMGPALNTTHDEARADAIVWNSGDETGQIVVDDSEVELVDGEEEALVTDDASGAP